MRIPSGKTDQKIFFVAVDATDLKTRKTGLSGFVVYRSRNGGTATVYTTPTVAELSSANMPGVYSLTIDEDTTIASTSDSEEYCVHITVATMAPVTRTIELYRREVTTGNTLDVSAGGEAGIDWANIGSPTTTVNLSGTTIKTSTDIATALTTIDDFVDTEVAAILAAVDTEVAAIKAKTDSLTFTVAGVVDANVQRVNDVTVNGTGAPGSEWGP